MTELTPRQILDAIRRGLEETARQFGGGRLDQMHRRPPPSESTDDQNTSPADVPSSRRNSVRTMVIASPIAV
jgi:hypothetical protein